jgi:hypothetical protein
MSNTKKLLADFMDTTIMVNSNTKLYIYKYLPDERWKLVKENKPPLQENELLEELEDGIYKVEIRGSDGRYVRPNVFYFKIENNSLIADMKPFKIESEQEEIEESESEFHPDYSNLFSAFAKMQENQLKQIKEMYENQIKILEKLISQKQEDSFDRLIKLKLKQAEIKILKELEESETESEEEEINFMNLNADEQEIIFRINEAIQNKKFGTAWMLFQELKEKNEKVAKFLLTEIVDKVLTGEINLNNLLSEMKKEGQNVQG